MERIELIKGDITKLTVDAIVNAANSGLTDGAGVNGAIHRAGGAVISEECKKIIAKQGSCPTGESVITRGGNLPARYVIHTVGPVWYGGNNNETAKLASCYKSSLKLAVETRLSTLAFPNISTGIFGYPKKEAAEVAVKAVKEFLTTDTIINKVFFVCFDEENLTLYQNLLK